MSITLVVVMTLAAGCAKTGYKRANKAVTSMAATRAEMQTGRQQVARTLNALNALVAAQVGDLRPKQQAFEREVADLKKSAGHVRKRADAARRNMARYFDKWGREIAGIENAEIQRESMKRRNETMLSYGRIDGPAQDAAAAYKPLIADLNDIQSHLKQDLTARGLAGARGFVAKATQDAAALQQKRDAVIEEIDRVTAEMNAQAGLGR